jgi:hypothetical protein
MAEKAETCRRITTCLYIIVSSYSAVVGIYMVTCLTARNMNNFKSTLHFTESSLFMLKLTFHGHKTYTVMKT